MYPNEIETSAPQRAATSAQAAEVAVEDAAQSPPPATSGASGALAAEAIGLNIEAALRVFTAHHFFGWTQGLLQSMVPHEVLICSLRKGETELSDIDGVTAAHAEPTLFSQLYRQEAALAEKLVAEWEARRFQPLLREVDSDPLFAGSVLARELLRIGATRLVAHGTHDVGGRMASFFVFALRADVDAAGLVGRIETLVPFLHAAWMRAKVGLSAKAGEGCVQAANRDVLTLREQEVLKWVYLGKSNIEIGIILGISPLTVKNHVQEILRRLNVQNRAQAVGKAFNMHILTC